MVTDTVSAPTPLRQDGLLFKNKVSPFEGATLEGRVT
jgi:dihydroorotase-like cyclic amidohydrolase